MAALVPLAVKMVIDYQNIHLTAHDNFAPNGTAKHESLIHPLLFAQQWLKTRNHQKTTAAMSSGESVALLQLDKVVAYRGLPSNKENPEGYRRNQAQKSEWTRDRRVEVIYRPLKYSWVNGVRNVQEKGVDVLVALDFVRSADRQAADVLVLASHDSDMEPALAAALESERCTIETVGWYGSRALKVPHESIWHTRLSAPEFVHSRDRKDYS